jgi:replicative DNA helicase
MSDQRLLFSAEAEMSVVGALLLDNGAFDRVGDKISPADFYIATNRVIYTAVRQLLLDGKKVDVVSLAGQMELDGTLDEAGGVEYLGTILRETPGSANVEHYAQLVRDRALERALVSASDEISMLARSLGPVTERMDRAQQLVLSITENAVEREPQMIRPLLSAFIEQLEKRNDRMGELLGLSTTIGDLDKKLAGFHPGQLVIIAGRPSMGKSSLAMQVATRTAAAGKVALVFSLEMSGTELAEKAVANLGRVNLETMRDGAMKPEDYERISAAMGRLHDAKLIVDDSPGMSVDQMRARARRVKRQHGLDLIVVDYLQLMQGRGDNRVEVVSEITRGLKLLAKECGVPVLALSQLNRNCESRTDKRPVMSDLRESGSVEQDADVIIFIYRDEVYNESTDAIGIAELGVAKQRMGPTGTVFTTWLGEYGMFADTEWKRAPKQEKAEKRKGFDDAF